MNEQIEQDQARADRAIEAIHEIATDMNNEKFLLLSEIEQFTKSILDETPLWLEDKT